MTLLNYELFKIIIILITINLVWYLDCSVLLAYDTSDPMPTAFMKCTLKLINAYNQMSWLIHCLNLTRVQLRIFINYGVIGLFSYTSDDRGPNLIF